MPFSNFFRRGLEHLKSWVWKKSDKLFLRKVNFTVFHYITRATPRKTHEIWEYFEIVAEVLTNHNGNLSTISPAWAFSSKYFWINLIAFVLQVYFKRILTHKISKSVLRLLGLRTLEKFDVWKWFVLSIWEWNGLDTIFLGSYYCKSMIFEPITQV